MDIFFLDANVLFSAAYRPDSRLRQLWKFKDVELVTSAYAAEEARRNLPLPEQKQALSELLDSLRLVLPTASSPVPEPQVSLPAKDRPVLSAAIDARATHLLTGDHRHFGPYYGRTIQGVLILPPSEYFRRRAEGSGTHGPA